MPRAPFKLRTGSVDAATRDGILELVGGMLELIGRAIQARAVNPARYGPNDAWVPDVADTETIGGSLASMAARRIPSGMGAESDVADLLTLTAGTAGYAIKNARLTAAIKRIHREGGFSIAEGANPEQHNPDAPRAA